MSFVENVMDKFRELKARRDSAFEEMPEDKTLHSLRRQRQKQLNEMEKKRLKKVVYEYNRAKDRKEIWGIEHNKPPGKLTARLTKKKSFLYDHKPLLKEKQPKVKNMFI